jgi:signal transduction histidine kinase
VNLKRFDSRGGLLRKYALVLGIAITSALVISGLFDLSFALREQTSAVSRLQSEQIRTSSAEIQRFISEARQQVEWAIPPAGLSATEATGLRLVSYQRLQRQFRAAMEVRYLDPDGREQLRVSQLSPNVVGSGEDYSNRPEFLAARSGGFYYSPVYFLQGSEPYMKVAAAEPPPRGGVTVADINLKLIWDVVGHIAVGKRGYVFVVDDAGQLVAHPDLSMVLRKTDLEEWPQVRAALNGEEFHEGFGAVYRGLRVPWAFSTHQRIDPPGWYVIGEQPLEEAFESLYGALARTALLFVWGLALTVIASFALASRMVTPIRALQTSAARIASGALNERVSVSTGDELEALANEFNHMAERVEEAHTGLEHQVTVRTQELADALEELEERSHELAEVSHRKSAFLAHLSHELRTPLNAIIGFSEVLSRQMYGPLNEKQLEYLDDILSSARHQLKLITGLLDIAKIENDEMALDLSRFSLVDALQSGLTMVREAAHRGQVTLGLEVAPGLDEVEADEGKVREIVVNLLSNAVKFTPPGGRVLVATREIDGEIQVAVRDTGIGIAPEDQGRIFDEFQQVTRRGAPRTEGTGLGLALTRRLVELHGGRIWVESELNAGSTFTFTLPLRTPDAPPDPHVRLPTPASARDVEPALGKSERAKVLVVDDDPHAVSLVDAVLRPQGYEVIGALSGDEGIELIRRERPGLVILDLGMPGTDGYAVVEWLRSEPDLAQIPVLVLTGERRDSVDRARLNGRISELVQKGDFTWPGFASLVQNYYGKRAA